jgi:hypothetical protein
MSQLDVTAIFGNIAFFAVLTTVVFLILSEIRKKEATYSCPVDRPIEEIEACYEEANRKNEEIERKWTVIYSSVFSVLGVLFLVVGMSGRFSFSFGLVLSGTLYVVYAVLNLSRLGGVTPIVVGVLLLAAIGVALSYRSQLSGRLQMLVPTTTSFDSELKTAVQKDLERIARLDELRESDGVTVERRNRQLADII